MIERALVPHPTTPAAWVDSLRVRIERGTGVLGVEFCLRGELSRLHLPADPTGRSDGLWRHTCCEVFIASTPAYREWNLAASGAWQAYDFIAYRKGMRPAAMQPPATRLERGPSALTLAARLPLADPNGLVRLGVAAVLEDRNGVLSYWALAHAGERPDFHHPASFTLTLDPTP